MAKCLLRGPWVVHTENGLGLSETVPQRITADWRAVCGKTACTVRRAGWRKPSRPLSPAARAGLCHLSGRGEGMAPLGAEQENWDEEQEDATGPMSPHGYGAWLSSSRSRTL